MNEIIKIDENTIGIVQQPTPRTKEQLLNDKKGYEDAVTYHTNSIVSIQTELDKVNAMLKEAEALGVKTQEEIDAEKVEVVETLEEEVVV